MKGNSAVFFSVQICEERSCSNTFESSFNIFCGNLQWKRVQLFVWVCIVVVTGDYCSTHAGPWAHASQLQSSWCTDAPAHAWVRRTGWVHLNVEPGITWSCIGHHVWQETYIFARHKTDLAPSSYTSRTTFCVCLGKAPKTWVGCIIPQNLNIQRMLGLSTARWYEHWLHHASNNVYIEQDLFSCQPPLHTSAILPLSLHQLTKLIWKCIACSDPGWRMVSCPCRPMFW